MTWVKRIAALLVLVVVGLFVLQWAASETTGEVIVLTTTDESGTAHETRLWVVDSGGEAWLRSGSDGASWYTRLVQNPTVQMTRNGETNTYTAVPVKAASDTVNGLMRAKYNWGEKVIGKMIDRSEAIAVRLQPQN